MLHLTLTGADAGRALCGKSRASRQEDNDKNLHAVYYNPAKYPVDGQYANPKHDFAGHHLCLACYAVYNDAMADEDTE